jgi:hypothetical protein
LCEVVVEKEEGWLLLEAAVASILEGIPIPLGLIGN